MSSSAGPRVRAKCCGTVIQSFNVHDHCSCFCGKIYIDGGAEYTRIGFPDGSVADWVEFLEPGWSLEPEEKKPVEKSFLRDL